MATKQKKRRVGLVILTELPHLGYVAILQTRGMYNFEKMNDESWPGGCQVTVHGGIEEDETPYQALERETKEELGMDLTHFKDPFTVISEVETEREIVTNFGIVVDASLVGRFSLHPGSGGLRFLLEEEINDGRVEDITVFDKSRGVRDIWTIAMFLDELTAVRETFERFRNA